MLPERVLVCGTGAMGCLFSARLAPFTEVWQLGSWPAGLGAVRTHGIRLTTDGHTAVRRVHVASLSREVPPVTLALIVVKSAQTARTAAWVAECLDQHGSALSLQNGLTHWPILRSILGPERTCAGVTFEGATLLAPGEVLHAGHGATLLGVPAGSRWLTLLNTAGFSATRTDNVQGLLFGKAVINAAINPITALLHWQNGKLLDEPAILALVEQVTREAELVALRSGVSLPYSDAWAEVVGTCRRTATNQSSMLQDVLRWRPTEIDAITGAIVAEASRLGVPAPLNEAILRLMHDRECEIHRGALPPEELLAQMPTTLSISGGAIKKRRQQDLGGRE
jgi:2-dehydropantoate 2-reductase